MTWDLKGNVGTDPATDFLGTQDAQPVVFRTDDIERARISVDGNVGLGSQVPAATLDVTGTTYLRHDAAGGIDAPAVEVGDQGQVTAGAPNGRIGFPGYGVRHGQIRWIPDAGHDGRFELIDSSTRAPSGDFGSDRALVGLWAGSALLGGVAIGRSAPQVPYEYEWETVGVVDPLMNLRLQSPNSIAFHVGEPRKLALTIAPGGRLLAEAGATIDHPIGGGPHEAGMEIGSRDDPVTAGAPNGRIGFPGYGVRHGQLRWVPGHGVDGRFEFVDSSAAHPAGDFGGDRALVGMWAGNAVINGVVIGRSADEVAYEYEYETIGVNHPLMNLRLQSPNHIVFHVGNPPRASVQITPDGDLQLLGADCAELFPSAEDGLAPGDLVAIAPDGRVELARHSNDTRVIGVVSGAGGLGPGIVMGSPMDPEPAAADRVAVALAGTVYCHADAAGGPILPGDMVAAGETEGHVCRAPHEPRVGTVVGKALGHLPHGRGLLKIRVGA